ncbi:MAG: 5'/3'-nucleotidase SurE [Gammaproteobacteria bacterium]|nr:MAG: 5'/3'-nucleotidase SurE [Gammaproteobacteria bacterium]
MRILVSNDDGYSADGIVALAAEIGKIADTDVIAPSHDCSGISQALTLNRPLRPRYHKNGFISIDGTPADCVHLGITGMLEQMPDMVVSGINAGVNMGDDVLYSGTVAAAIEGRFLERPAIAFSVAQAHPQHYDAAAMIARDITRRVIEDEVEGGIILNVNIPDLPLEEIAGIKITRLGRRKKSKHVVRETDPRGKEIFWIGPPGDKADASAGTDFHAVANNFVSITPLTTDLCYYSKLESLAGLENRTKC